MQFHKLIFQRVIGPWMPKYIVKKTYLHLLKIDQHGVAPKINTADYLLTIYPVVSRTTQETTGQIAVDTQFILPAMCTLNCGIQASILYWSIQQLQVKKLHQFFSIQTVVQV